MDRKVIQRVIAIVLALVMLLGENGAQTWVLAASTDTKENTQSASSAEQDIDEVSVSGETNSDPTGKSEVQNEETKDNSGADSGINSDEKSDASDSLHAPQVFSTVTYTEPNSGSDTSEQSVALPIIGEGDNLSLGEIKTGTLYLIQDYRGWIALANYSKGHNLYGYKFGYNLIDGGSTYDFTSSDASGYTGLGSADNPFAGELKSTYSSNTITLKLNQPLFDCLSSKATISNIKIESIGGSGAGLAKVLVAEGDTPIADYKDINIGGSIGKDDMKSQAGGLFAQIQNSTGKELTIQGNNVSVSASVQGQTAGGLTGELQGSTKIILDGFDFSPSQVKGISGNGFANGEGCVGGLIGYVNGSAEGGTKQKLTLTTSNGTAYEYTKPEYNCSGNSRYCGGFFGRVQNSDIDVKCPLTYNGNMNSDGIIGYDAGAFAGSIEGAKVTLYNRVICSNVRLDHPFNNNLTDWESYGIGLFAGSIHNAQISVANDYISQDASAQNEPAAILIRTDDIEDTTDDTKKPNCKNTSTYNNYNLGGLIGRSENSDLQFTSAHPCKLKSMKLDNGLGNMGGAVGYFSASENTHNIDHVIFAEKNMANLMNRGSGYTGGLVGQVHLSDSGNVTISNSQFNGRLRFTASDNSAISVGVLVGGVLSDKDSASGKITLNTDSANSFDIEVVNNKGLNSFGGAVGKIDADFILKDSNISTSGLNFYKDGIGWMTMDYFGGLIGSVDNSNSAQTRKGEIIASNGKTITVSTPLNKAKIYDAYGGLFGSVGSNTAISLSGNISEAGQKSYLYDRKYPSCAGSIVGQQNNSLIYMEDAGKKFTKSENLNGLDEIGNYGGVIRNKDWDSGSGNETDDKKLIQNFQVTGTLSNELKTTGDLLRFAIAMNTQGVFLPEGNKNATDEGALTTIEDVQKAQYTLSQESYDLIDTGLSCLSRNDDTGVSNTPFQGTLKGTSASGKTTINYSMTNHNQAYSGLFASVDGGGNQESKFENLDLHYSIVFAKNSFTNDNYNDNDNKYKYNDKEHAGGLAAVAQGNIAVKNVSYSGTIQDAVNSSWDKNEKKFRRYVRDGNKYEDKSDDYMGGIFGNYIGTDNSSLAISQLSCENSNFICQDYTHVMGGVIGYVDLDSKLASGQSCSIKFDGTEETPVLINGQINVTDLYNKNTDGYTFPIRVGGLIAQIGTGRSPSYAARCNLTMNHIQIDGLKLTESSNVTSDSEIGGLLGWQWNDVNASLLNATIGTTTDTGLSVYAPFGGLVHTITGKMLVDQLNFGSKVTLDTNNSGVDQCGLLVRNGQYLYLDLRDYNFNSTVKLTNYNGSYFDELVGFTKGSDEENIGDSSHGGIVTIGFDANDSYYLGRNNGEYKSYFGGNIVDPDGNKINKTNPNTRYYYDLNKLTWPEMGSGDKDTTINLSNLDTPDDVMCWHLLHYVNPYLKSCLSSAYQADSKLPSDYTIGNVNMQGYSIYPTSVTNENYTGGSINFDANSIITGEKSASATPKVSKYPEDEKYEHYQMQAGLFADVSGLSVNGLIISGSYSVQNPSAGAKAGALVAGTIYGIEDGKDTNGNTLYKDTIKNTFQNIVLNNLWCVSSQDTLNYEAPIGLMIADISSGSQVELDGISMKGYVDTQVTDNNKAASALIGNVGGETATYIALSFKNMDIADAAKDKSSDGLKSSKMDEALAMASFIYSYNYAENCSGIYTFTYEDYLYGRCIEDSSKNNLVTLGNELGNNGKSPNYAIEEYYDKESFVGCLMDGEDKEIIYDCENYLPYVYTTDKKILVNPKTGHIEHGCGTYEDPYVISSTRQLLTLYRYLYEEDQFSDILANGAWRLNPVGDDSKCCDKTTDATNGHGTAKVYSKTNNEQFPLKKDLSQAYYQITADIDLRSYPEFTGFGRTDLPFTGVFVGKETSELSPEYPTITMPVVPSTSELSNYGWIQSAKGCVVKNLVIHFPKSVTINQQAVTVNNQGQSVLVDEGGIGGGVIATVLGGENIIDGVTVTGASSCFTAKNNKAMIGGYVGIVNAGGVLLRNMALSSLANFSVSTTESLNQYPYVCGIIGRVYNGYVVYDGGTDSSIQLFKNLIGLYKNSSNMEQSRSYDILNGAYLADNDNLSDTDNGKISWSSTTGFGNIANAKRLQVLSMALNAGLLNANQSGLNQLYVGYNGDSRQRSGDYRYVGQVLASGDSAKARNNVTMYDNQNGAVDDYAPKYHSYLSQFFKWDDMINTNGTSKDLNPSNTVTNYSLTGDTYDMSVFGTAFRGLGARYFGQEDTRGDVFHGNLKGLKGNAKIKLDMKVDDPTKDNILDVTEDAAFLNNVIRTSKFDKSISIENITLTGKVCNQAMDNVIADNGVGTKNAAALISTLKNVNVNFKNVKLDTMEVVSQKYAGGFVAYNPSGTSGAYTISFENCSLTGSDDTHPTKITGYADVGGYVGFTKNKVNVNVNLSKDAASSELKNLHVENNSNPSKKGIDISNSNNTWKNVGGLIGSTVAQLNIKKIYGLNLEILTSGDQRNAEIGGLVGLAKGSSNYDFQDVTLENLTVKNNFNGSYGNISTESVNVIGTAGIIGAVDGTMTMQNIIIGNNMDDTQSVIIENTSEAIPGHNYYSTSGLIGRHLAGGNIGQATNCHVYGCKKTDGTYTTLIKGRGSNVAGIIGNCRSFKGKNISVENVTLNAARYCGGFAGWLESSVTCDLSTVTFKNLNISLHGSSNDRKGIGGMIGYCDGSSNLLINGVEVNSVVIESDYCNFTGGIVGSTQSKSFAISGENNSVSNCILGGSCVGGVVGGFEKINDYKWSCNNITISNNKLIASREDGNYGINGRAGGFAGQLASGSNNHLYVNGLSISNNLIAAYDKNNNLAMLGGVAGYMKSESCFYNVTLTDNYIGMMNYKDLGDTSDARKLKLKTTAIESSESQDALNNLLYFITENSTGTSTSFTDKEYHTVIENDDLFKYSYRQGAILGNADSANGMSKFVNVNIHYSNPRYRPVSDVGAKSDAKLQSNADMYSRYRSLCSIVYDGKSLENTTQTICDKFGVADTDSFHTNVPYVFGNIDSIMDEFNQGSDLRNAYRLDFNYQENAMIDSGKDYLSVEQIYASSYSYKDEEKNSHYWSPFQTSNGEAIPMIVYRSSENGDLNQVLQTYINILTNNSGGVNSLVNQQKDTNLATVLSVTPYAMKLENGVLSMTNEDPSVNVTSSPTDGAGKGNTIYSFSSTKGDDLTSATSGTFTLIRIEYGWKYNGKSDSAVHLTLDLPIYVEKRLQLFSNMKMLEGIEYNTQKIKTNGKNELESTPMQSKKSMILSRGSSYSIYSEYVYVDSEKFSSVKIPKALCIESKGDDYFLPGTKLTLIPLDEGGKAYYYTVPDDQTKPKAIAFTEFRDADGNSYRTKEMISESKQTDYKDLCKTTYSGNSLVERFVILADTSDIKDITSGTDQLNKLYEMNVAPIRPEDLKDGSNQEQYRAMYSRTDYHKHCYGYINEIRGITYKINTGTDGDSGHSNTYLDASSKISQDGKVSTHLQYDLKADPTYWDSVKNTDKSYLDVGFSLAIRPKDSDTSQKIPLPEGTNIVLGSGENKVTLPTTAGQSTAYYYQCLRSVSGHEGSEICINTMGKDTSNKIDFAFDFSGADLTVLDAYEGSDFYVVAQLVVTSDSNLPSAGDIKDTWNAAVGAEMKSDFGFALNVDDLTTLGMNQYSPEGSDQGVVSYTASIAFPENKTSELESKFYTIVYQIEEKTSQKDAATGKPAYKPYDGDKVSLYLGNFDTPEKAINAKKRTENSTTSGTGLVAATYQFSTDQITVGADLKDGKNASESDDITKWVIKTHCTLVANCEGLNMTNYRVKAYLMVSDELPSLSTSSGDSISYSEPSGDSNSGCLKQYWVRPENWPTISDKILISDLKSDYFVFTVAKIKTTM